MEIKTAAAIGMGAVGTVYAKRLYDQYGSHFFAIADHERAERLRSSGVTLDGEAFFPQICEPEQADGAVDLILICVKLFPIKVYFRKKYYIAIFCTNNSS